MARYNDVDHGVAAYVAVAALAKSLDEDTQVRFSSTLRQWIHYLENRKRKTDQEPVITSPSAVLELVQHLLHQRDVPQILEDE